MTDRIPLSGSALDKHFLPAILSTSPLIVIRSLKAPGQEKPSVNALLVQAKGEPKRRAGHVLDRAEWDFLVSERAAIFYESGMVSTRCLSMALADTTQAHGQRPQAAA